MKAEEKKKALLVGGAIVVVVVLAAFFLSQPAPVPGEPGGPAAEKIEFIELSVPDCTECVSFEKFRQQLSDSNKEFEYSEVQFDSEEGKALVEQYALESAPTVILKNAPADLFGNWSEVGSVEGDGALVFRQKIPVYLDLAEGKFAGNVKLTKIIDSSCAECADPFSSFELALLASNIKVTDAAEVEANSAEGKALLKKYHLDFVPAVIFSGELRDYNFFEQFAPLGSTESDGSFVVRTKFPPYKNIGSGEVKGILSVIVIDPTSCWACNGAKEMLAFLNQNLGLSFSQIDVLSADSEDALALAENYSVEYAPAALITGDLYEYAGLEETIPQIGRVFIDGVYAIDNPLLLGEGYYLDLNSGEIITVSTQE